MKVFPSRRQVARAQARLVFRFFMVMLLVTFTFAAIVAGHYALGWW
jgi:hypothetical protein